MHRSLRYLKSAAKALSKVLARSVANALEVPEYAVEIPLDLAWEWGKQLRADLSGESSEQVRRAYQEVIKPGPDYSDDELIEAVNAGFLDAPEPVRMTALALLGQIQSQGRQSLKRQDDPSGTTLPATLRFDSVEDHATRLPNALPKYKVGDRPIQGYVLAERLGVGGFGEVWKAHSPKYANMDVVALKFFTDLKARDWLASHEADVLDRVQTEVRHEGIVRLLSVYDDPACLKFEYVKGWTLSRQILDWHAQGSPDARFIAGEFRRIVEILVDVHEIKPDPIVHRDLKPANILVETLPGDKLRYRVTDFGIGGFAASEVARNTRMGTVDRPRNPSLLRGAHSPLYASDEQKQGRNPDPRDDIFSLGVLWYQMQTGRLDSGPPTGMIWGKQLQEQGLSEGLVELMASCFESKAEDRAASARVLLERLKKILTPRVEPVAPQPHKPEPVVIEPVAPPPRKLEPVADLITTKTAAIPLKLIPAGTFLMGSPEGVGKSDESPRHKVRINRSFYLGIHQVTQAQYMRLMGINPSWFAATGVERVEVAGMDTSQFPVENVSWYDAVEFRVSLQPTSVIFAGRGGS